MSTTLTLVLFTPPVSLNRVPRISLPTTCTFHAPTSLLTPPQQNALIALSLPSLPLVTYSEYTLLINGCGLPPGPYGLLGAAEGISYLVLASIVLLSLYSKLTTGKGLPEGPAKLLGAAEGIAFLLATTGLAIAAYTTYKFGSLPTAVPQQGSRCFPTQ